MTHPRYWWRVYSVLWRLGASRMRRSANWWLIRLMQSRGPMSKDNSPKLDVGLLAADPSYTRSERRWGSAVEDSMREPTRLRAIR